jgi:hypothetical protein
MISALVGYVNLLEIKQPHAAVLLRAVVGQFDEDVGSLVATLSDMDVCFPRPYLKPDKEFER